MTAPPAAGQQSANTGNGLPYPVGTDYLIGGDDAIKALAQALDLRVPQPKVVYGSAGYTTNAYGGIIIPVPGMTFRGLVAVTQQAGYACVVSTGAPVGQAWLNVYTTNTGAVVANAFIVVYFVIWGS
jgi:hypothetical protein